MSESVESAAAPEAAAPEASPVVDAAAAAKVEPARRTVKVDGKELQVTDEELVKGYQLESASRSRMQEATTKLAEAKALEAKLRQPGKVAALRDAGWTDEQIEQLSVEVLSAKQRAVLDEERLKAMDPKERELLDLKKRLEEFDAEKKKQAEATKQSQVQAAHQAITGAVIRTLELFPEVVRRSPALAARVLDSWGDALDNAEELQKQGVQVTPEYIAKLVADEFRGLNKGFIAHAKDDELDELLPPTVRARLAKQQRASAESAAHPELTAKPQVRAGTSSGAGEATVKRITSAQLLRRSSRPG